MNSLTFSTPKSQFTRSVRFDLVNDDGVDEAITAAEVSSRELVITSADIVHERNQMQSETRNIRDEVCTER